MPIKIKLTVRTVIERVKKRIRGVLHFCQDSFVFLYINLLNKKAIRTHYRSIPIIINNFNRLSTLRNLVEWLKKNKYTTIVILDNQSTYPPLLEYYKTCDVKVIRLDKNYGHLALWKSGIYHTYKWNYFVYTDSDVLPIEACPENFLLIFYESLQRYFSLKKVGFSIKIDDLPDHFSFKEKVIEYEKKYWENHFHAVGFDAPIDTTFALYKPFTTLRYGEVYTQKAIRMKPPYTIRHFPWYNDSENLNEEELYYIEKSNSSSTISKQLAGNKIY